MDVNSSRFLNPNWIKYDSFSPTGTTVKAKGAKWHPGKTIPYLASQRGARNFDFINVHV